MYEKFMALEDAHWAHLAVKVQTEGYLGEDETEIFLKRVG